MMDNFYLDLPVDSFCVKSNLACISLVKTLPDGSEAYRTVTDAFARMWNPMYESFAPRHLMITEDGTPTSPFYGLISDRDILHWYYVGDGMPKDDVFIKDLMRAKYPDAIAFVNLGSSIEDALMRFVTPYFDRYISILPVLSVQSDGSALLAGILSYIDILRKIKSSIARGEEAILLPDVYIVEDWMTPKETVEFAIPSTTFNDAYAYISNKHRRTLPLLQSTDDKVVLGMITDRSVYLCRLRYNNAKRDNMYADDPLLVIRSSMVIKPSDSLVSIIGYFEGKYDRPDALIVSSDGVHLDGVLSYVDVFRAVLSVTVS